MCADGKLPQSFVTEFSLDSIYCALAQNRNFKFSSNVPCSEASFLAKFAGDVGPQGSPEATESKLKFEEENS